ncbi:hypothetical protein FJZ33_09725, partial [Candidatus Poribacteria bacterium]|nr:hypothetical protein [Candidatus Poribacteria bacterium]
MSIEIPKNRLLLYFLLYLIIFFFNLSSALAQTPVIQQDANADITPGTQAEASPVPQSPIDTKPLAETSGIQEEISEEVEPGKAPGNVISQPGIDFPRRFGYDYFAGARSKIIAQEQTLVDRPLTRVEKDAISGFVGPIDMMSANVTATVPSKYVLSPGDKLKVQYWSDVVEPQTINLVVDSKGEVTIPKIGEPIVVRGMTLAQFQDAAKDMIERVAYKNLKLIASLENLRSIQIFITGEAFRPGSYAVSAVSTLFNTLYNCGGPSVNGSLRNIKLLRDSETKIVDFYKYLMDGDSSQDYSLEAGDTIFISPVGRAISVSGEVKRPAIYELKEGENLLELISLAGGILPGGFLQRIQI